MENIMESLPTILIIAAIVVAMALIQIFVNKANKKKRYEAKVKAGIIKEGEPIVSATPEENKKKMDAAIELANRSKKDKE